MNQALDFLVELKVYGNLEKSFHIKTINRAIRDNNRNIPKYAHISIVKIILPSATNFAKNPSLAYSLYDLH